MLKQSNLRIVQSKLALSEYSTETMSLTEERRVGTWDVVVPVK